ncbi:hypothetical protein [Moorena producens]|uniref:hypothetical protein n=1 Tax=Moorena producens TaxID=1155739 RepID=UPI003C72C99A
MSFLLFQTTRAKISPATRSADSNPDSIKANPEQWLSIVADQFRMSTNGGPKYNAQTVADIGTYNVFLGDTEHYRSTEETFEQVRVTHSPTWP